MPSEYHFLSLARHNTHHQYVCATATAMCHHHQVELQERDAQLEMLQSDLNHARSELTAERHRRDEEAAAASEAGAATRRLYEERLKAERDKADLEVDAVREQVRAAVRQVEQAREAAHEGVEAVKRAMEESMSRAIAAVRAEHTLRLDECERRVGLLTDEKTANEKALAAQVRRACFVLFYCCTFGSNYVTVHVQPPPIDLPPP
jgi:hypothetical protein